MILGRNPNPGRVLMDIADDAELRGFLDAGRIRHAQRTDKWPESLMPGRYIMRLQDDVRNILKKLRSSELTRARYPLH